MCVGGGGGKTFPFLKKEEEKKRGGGHEIFYPVLRGVGGARSFGPAIAPLPVINDQPLICVPYRLVDAVRSIRSISIGISCSSPTSPPPLDNPTFLV